MRPFFFLSGLFVCLFLMTVPALAHGGLQSALQKRVGDDLIDVGYDAYVFESGKNIILNFALINNPDDPNWEFEEYDEVQASFTPKDGTPVIRTIKLEAPMAAYATHTFPADGPYDLTARFLLRGKIVSEATFPIYVGNQPIPIRLIVFSFGSVMLLVAGLVAVILWPFLWKKVRTSRI